MARRKSDGPNYFTLGALWWFAIGSFMGILHMVFPGLVETPTVVVIAVVLALVGTFAIVYFVRPK